MVVRGIRRYRNKYATPQGGSRSAALQRSSEKQRKQGNDPRGEQIKMSQQMGGDIWRASEHESAQQSEAAVARDLDGQRIGARRIKEH